MQKQKKIKIFLGGTINGRNAQNLNCLALAKYLDKSKYEIYTMAFEKGDFDVETIEGVKIIKARLPYRIFKYWIWLKGLAICDISYLPHYGLYNYLFFWKKILRKKVFRTIEGTFINSNYDALIHKFKNEKNIRKQLNKPDKNFAITKFMANYNHKRLGIRFDGVLYLGVDFDLFKNNRSIDCLTDIVFIGNNLKYKGIEDYYKVAKNFPKINFHIIGGEGNYDIVNETKKRNLPNVILHGSLSHDKLSEVLKNVQLMFFPSRSEGFPKVTLECAAAGVPSIVYGDYGADEWITTGENGYVVNTLDEAKNVIEDIIANPDKLKELSKNAVKLGKKFDWEIVIKEWEREIEKIVNLK